MRARVYQRQEWSFNYNIWTQIYESRCGKQFVLFQGVFHVADKYKCTVSNTLYSYVLHNLSSSSHTHKCTHTSNGVPCDSHLSDLCLMSAVSRISCLRLFRRVVMLRCHIKLVVLVVLVVLAVLHCRHRAAVGGWSLPSSFTLTVVYMSRCFCLRSPSPRTVFWVSIQVSNELRTFQLYFDEELFMDDFMQWTPLPTASTVVMPFAFFTWVAALSCCDPTFDVI